MKSQDRAIGQHWAATGQMPEIIGQRDRAEGLGSTGQAPDAARFFLFKNIEINRATAKSGNAILCPNKIVNNQQDKSGKPGTYYVGTQRCCPKGQRSVRDGDWAA